MLLIVPLVRADSYVLPGSTAVGKYNNIGVLGEVMLDINVTVINVAPFPKFVVVNPRYSFRVYRMGNVEYGDVYRDASGNIVSVAPPDLTRNTLNYFVGFWLMPYETAVVNFKITSNSSYAINPVDYESHCGNVGKITEVEYTNGTFAGGKVYTGDIEPVLCGVIYPQLINSPRIMYVRGMFPILDSYVRVLKYEGTVRFRLTNVPNEGGDFYTFFAVAVPMIFPEADMYGFTPNYTMTYRGYTEEFLPKYLGLDTPRRPEPQPQGTGLTLFQLSPTLLSGPSLNTLEIRPPEDAGLDFPVWVVLMGNSLEIEYRVKWTAGR
nr:hypothetical protein [Thermococcus sp. M36]